jgi:hypothetical protein
MIVQDQQANARYLRQGGARCPECQSYNLKAGTPVMNDSGSMITCDISCVDCGAQWADTYTLADMEVTKHGNGGGPRHE